jgi:predicted GIY-YIG superfamily endonuclease
MTGIVYLLHFDQPYKHARHYVGWTARNVKRRLAEHEAGRGRGGSQGHPAPSGHGLSGAVPVQSG